MAMPDGSEAFFGRDAPHEIASLALIEGVPISGFVGSACRCAEHFQRSASNLCAAEHRQFVPTAIAPTERRSRDHLHHSASSATTQRGNERSIAFSCGQLRCPADFDSVLDHFLTPR